MDEQSVRPLMVDELIAAVSGKRSEEHTLEVLYNSSADEKTAAARRLGQLAELEAGRAHALGHAIATLRPYWRISGTLLDALKIAPAPVVAEVLALLRRSGWTEAEIGPPDPRSQ